MGTGTHYVPAGKLTIDDEKFTVASLADISSCRIPANEARVIGRPTSLPAEGCLMS